MKCKAWLLAPSRRRKENKKQVFEGACQCQPGGAPPWRKRGEGEGRRDTQEGGGDDGHSEDENDPIVAHFGQDCTIALQYSILLYRSEWNGARSIYRSV